MSAPKFTPGPWTLFPTPADLDMVFEVRTEDGPVAAIYGRAAEDENARLIAAAPELYEALAKIDEWLHAFGTLRRADALHCDAIAALAKARGEQ